GRVASRKEDDERRAVSRATSHSDRATEEGDELARVAEAEARAPVLLRPVELVEVGAERGEVLRANADAGVYDRDRDGRAGDRTAHRRRAAEHHEVVVDGGGKHGRLHHLDPDSPR